MPAWNDLDQNLSDAACDEAHKGLGEDIGE